MHLRAASGHSYTHCKSFHLMDGWKYTHASLYVCAVLVFARGGEQRPRAKGVWIFIYFSICPPACSSALPCHLTVTLLYNGPDLVLLLLLDSFAHTRGGRGPTNEYKFCQFSGQHVLRLPVMCRAANRERDGEPKSRPQHLHILCAAAGERPLSHTRIRSRWLTMSERRAAYCSVWPTHSD